MTTTELNQLREALSIMLDTFGFQAMAKEVKTETDIVNFKKYANVCINNCPSAKKPYLISLFSRIGLR